MADIHRGLVIDSHTAEKTLLREAHRAAEDTYSERVTDSAGVWFGKRYSIRALAESIHADAPHLRVRLGGGPRAARGTSETTIVVDAAHSTPRRLVLYGESAGGAIWTLTAAPDGKPRISKSAVAGIASLAAPALRLYPLAPAVAADSTRVVVSIAEGGPEQPAEEILVEVGADGLVRTFLEGSAVVAPVVGAGPVDTREFADRLVQAYATGGGAARCALLHAELAAVFGDECTSKRNFSARDVTTDTQRIPSADGTSLLALSIGAGPDAFTVFFLVTPGSKGLLVTGIFVDVSEFVALATRPI